MGNMTGTGGDTVQTSGPTAYLRNPITTGAGSGYEIKVNSYYRCIGTICV